MYSGKRKFDDRQEQQTAPLSTDNKAKKTLDGSSSSTTKEVKEDRHPLHKDLQKSLNRLKHNIAVYNYNLNAKSGAKNPLYVCVPQGKDVCISSKDTPSNIIGVFTKEFSICNPVAIVGTGKGQTRVSLTHTDINFNVNIFEGALQSIEWLEGGAQILIYCRDEKEGEQFVGSEKIFSENIRPALGERPYTRQPVSTDVVGISVDRSGNIKLHKEYPDNLLLHPHHYQTELVTKLYEYILWGEREIHITTPFYNDSTWTELGKTEIHLSEHAQRVLKDCDISPKDNYLETSKKFVTYYINHPKIFGLDEIPKEMHAMLQLRGRNAASILQQFYNLNNDNVEDLFLLNVKSVIDCFKMNVKKPDEVVFLDRLEKILGNKEKNIYQEICAYIFKIMPPLLDDVIDIVSHIMDCIEIRNGLLPYYFFRKGQLYNPETSSESALVLTKDRVNQPLTEVTKEKIAASLTLGGVITSASQSDIVALTAKQQSRDATVHIPSAVTNSIKPP